MKDGIVLTRRRDAPATACQKLPCHGYRQDHWQDAEHPNMQALRPRRHQLCTANLCHRNLPPCLLLNRFTSRVRLYTAHTPAPLLDSEGEGPARTAVPDCRTKPWGSAHPCDIVHTEEGVCYEQCLDGAQLMGGTHMPRAIECAGTVLAQHVIEVLQGLCFPGSFCVLQAGAGACK